MAIAANQLRIGNLAFDQGGKVLRIDGWENRKKIYMDMPLIGGRPVHPLTEDIEFLQPIPLSEEWLLRLGFDLKRGKEYHNRKINEGAYHISPVGDVYEHWYFYHKQKLITSNVRFVHQLQNLYFALTGEELTINN